MPSRRPPASSRSLVERLDRLLRLRRRYCEAESAAVAGGAEASAFNDCDLVLVSEILSFFDLAALCVDRRDLADRLRGLDLGDPSRTERPEPDRQIEVLSTEGGEGSLDRSAALHLRAVTNGSRELPPSVVAGDSLLCLYGVDAVLDAGTLALPASSKDPESGLGIIPGAAIAPALARSGIVLLVGRPERDVAPAFVESVRALFNAPELDLLRLAQEWRSAPPRAPAERSRSEQITALRARVEELEDALEVLGEIVEKREKTIQLYRDSSKVGRLAAGAPSRDSAEGDDS